MSAAICDVYDEDQEGNGRAAINDAVRSLGIFDGEEQDDLAYIRDPNAQPDSDALRRAAGTGVFGFTQEQVHGRSGEPGGAGG